MKDRPLFRLEYVRDKNGNPIKYLEAHDFKTGGKEITNPVEKQRIKDYFSWVNYCPDGRFDLEITLEDIEESRRRVKQFENKSNQELNPQFLNLPQIQKPQPKPRLKPRRELKNLPEFLRNILRS